MFPGAFPEDLGQSQTCTKLGHSANHLRINNLHYDWLHHCAAEDAEESGQLPGGRPERSAWALVGGVDEAQAVPGWPDTEADEQTRYGGQFAPKHTGTHIFLEMHLEIVCSKVEQQIFEVWHSVFGFHDFQQIVHFSYSYLFPITKEFTVKLFAGNSNILILKILFLQTFTFLSV